MTEFEWDRCWRGDRIWIISARNATKSEGAQYAGMMMDEYDFRLGKRGPVIPPQAGKTRITIRLDTDIVEWFQQQVDAAGGGNYQTLINQALREHIVERKQPLEKLLRKIIREELRRSG